MSEFISLQQEIKISCLSRGIKITPAAELKITNNGSVPLSLHEYTTTGGVTFRMNDIYVNAPFDEWYCDAPEVILDIEQDSDQFFVYYKSQKFLVNLLSLPRYFDQKDNSGYFIKEISMSHADRLRVSPVSGCAFGCNFCDFGLKRYDLKPIERVLDSMHLALSDTQLPIKHILISGGTPRPKDYAYYEKVSEAIINNSKIPVDVMLAPRTEDVLKQLVLCGAHGFSINIEIYDRDIARKIMPSKWNLGLLSYAEFITKALELTGGNGKVRSLIIVGLEPLKNTLEGVEFLAKLGCDPVLSPFRPGMGTPLQHVRPPSVDFLKEVYAESINIVDRYGVKLGPRCIPCQHNTLTFPDAGLAYYYS